MKYDAKKLQKMREKRKVGALVKALGFQDDDFTRSIAANALGEIGDLRAVEPLISALKDRANGVRESAAKALGLLGDRRAVEPLIKTLADPHMRNSRYEDMRNMYLGARKRAAEALGKLGDASAAEQLTEALKEEDAELRQTAANALANIGAPAAGKLAAALENQDMEVRLAAVRGLGRIGDACAAADLVRALKDGEQQVRHAAAAALQSMGWQPKEDWEKASYCIAKDDFDSCIAIGAAAVEPLIAVLKDKDMDTRRNAAETLGKIGDARAAEPLVGRLGEKGKEVPQAAAEALEKIGMAAVEPLVAALRSDRKQMQRGAADVLEALGWQPERDEDKASFLIAKGDGGLSAEAGAAPSAATLIAILKDEERGTFAGAAEMLGKLGDANAVEPLVHALQNRVPLIRAAAARALGKIGQQSAFAPLEKAAGEKEDGVREAAVRALGEIGDPRAINTLRESLKDSMRPIRAAAAVALDRLGWKPQEAEEKAYYCIAKEEYGQCAEIGKPAAAPLAELLRYDYYNELDLDTRLLIAKALGEFGDASAAEPLIRALRKGESEMKLCAAEALGKLGDSSAEHQLLLALTDDDPELQIAAATALGRLGSTPARVILMEEAVKTRRSDVLAAIEGAMVRLRAPAMQALNVALADNLGEVRNAVTEALDEIKWKPKTAEEKVAYCVAKLDFKPLLKMKRDAVDPLIALLTRSQYLTRIVATEALGELGDARAVEPLMETLTWFTEYMFMRGFGWSAVISALGRIGDARAVNLLIAALRDEDKLVCRAAAEALGSIGDARAVQPLHQALEHEDEDVRNTAEEALRKLGEAAV